MTRHRSFKLEFAQKRLLPRRDPHLARFSDIVFGGLSWVPPLSLIRSYLLPGFYSRSTPRPAIHSYLVQVSAATHAPLPAFRRPSFELPRQALLSVYQERNDGVPTIRSIHVSYSRRLQECEWTRDPRCYIPAS